MVHHWWRFIKIKAILEFLFLGSWKGKGCSQGFLQSERPSCYLCFERWSSRELFHTDTTSNEPRFFEVLTISNLIAGPSQRTPLSTRENGIEHSPRFPLNLLPINMILSINGATSKSFPKEQKFLALGDHLAKGCWKNSSP